MAQPAHGALLRDLANTTDWELVWATTWMHEANTRIAPAIGLPESPVIEFPLEDLDPDHGWHAEGAWTWRAISEFAAERPLAWLDDEHRVARFRAARTAFDHDRRATPTSLCHVDPHTGMQTRHLDHIRTWAATLPG